MSVNKIESFWEASYKFHMLRIIIKLTFTKVQILLLPNPQVATNQAIILIYESMLNW
jgi:hypothetical protein